MNRNKKIYSWKNKKIKVFYGWWIVFTIFICLFLEYGLRYSFNVFFKSLLEEFGNNRSEISLIFSLHMAVYGVSSFFWGWLSDRLNVRVIISLGCAMAGGSAILMYFCSSLWQIFLLFSIFAALGTGAIYVPGISTIGKFFKKKRGLVMGITSAAIGFSYIWSPISERVIYFYGWRTAYLIIGILLLNIAAPLSWRLIRSSPEELGLSPDGEEKNIANEEKLIMNKNLLSAKKNYSMFSDLKSAPIWILNLIYILAILGVYMVNTHIVMYARDMGVNFTRAASIPAFLGIFSVIGRITIGRFSDKKGRGMALYLSFIFQIVGLFLLTLGKFTSLLYLGTFILGIGYGGWVPQIPSCIGDIYCSDNMGGLVGVNTLFGTAFGATLGPWLAGYIYDVTGRYTLAFILGVLFSFIALFFSFFLFKLRSLRKHFKMQY